MSSSTLLSVLHEVFPDADLPADISGLALGAFEAWDSLGHFNLMMALEEAYGVRFSMDEMVALKSIALITQALQTRGLAP
jgi:acyl carrier protein